MRWLETQLRWVQDRAHGGKVRSAMKQKTELMIKGHDWCGDVLSMHNRELSQEIVK